LFEYRAAQLLLLAVGEEPVLSETKKQED